MIRIWLLISLCVASFSLHLETEIHEENLIQSDQFQDLRASELQRHNFYRSKHGCQGLSLNQSLNNIAQNYSEYLATNLHKISHSQPAQSGDYGENLYWSWGSPTQTYKNGEASDSWYSQESKYTYGQFPPADGTGHFTAMIWKTVTSVGFGYYKVQENEGQAIYVVANYYPVPNVYTEQEYTANVPKPNQNTVPQQNNTNNSNLDSNQITQQPYNPQDLNDETSQTLLTQPSETSKILTLNLNNISNQNNTNWANDNQTIFDENSTIINDNTTNLNETLQILGNIQNVTSIQTPMTDQLFAQLSNNSTENNINQQLNELAKEKPLELPNSASSDEPNNQQNGGPPQSTTE